MLQPSHLRTALVSALTFTVVGLAANADTPRPGEPGEILGMTAIMMREGHHSGPDDCDEIGPTSTAVWLKHYATAEQRARLTSLQGPDDELHVTANNAPGYSDLCTSPAARLAAAKNYPKPPQVLGRKAYGLNLDGTSDGRATPTTCEHKKFEGLSGEPAVDNELYRVLGCQRYWRYDTRTSGEAIKDVFDYDQGSPGNKQLASGGENTLLEIRGVDDRRNDPEVEVFLASGQSAPIIGQDNRPVGWTTQFVDPNPRWQARVKGRIENGILHTDTFDFKLKRRYNSATGHYEMRGARMRLELTENGGARGVIGGYFPVESTFWFRPGWFGRNLAVGGKHNCAGWYKALFDAADGYPDPETGQCTTISGALAVEFIPAFVRPSPKMVTASVHGRYESE